MAEGKQDFLRRWSQRKNEAARRAATPSDVPTAAGEAPPLPPVDSLSFDSDFKAFMHAKVQEAVKRAALKKLFTDPRFNVMDGLDIYIDDYSKGEILPDDMLAKLEHAKSTLFGPTVEPRAAAQAAEVEGAAAVAQAGGEDPPADRRREENGNPG